MDDLRNERSRHAADDDLIDRAEAPPSADPSHYIGQVYDGGSKPVLAERYYLTHPVTVGGSECEGCARTLTVDATASVAVLVLGGSPAVGANLIARSVAGRWVADLIGVSAPPGTCTLTIHVQQRSGSAPISGASVTVTKVSDGSAVGSGTTDSSGSVAFAGLAVTTNYHVVVTYDGLMLAFNTPCATINVCYCTASITYVVTPSDATITFPTLNPIPDTPGSFSNTVVGNTWTYRELALCSAFSALPNIVTVSATKADHVGRCNDFSLHCGDHLTGGTTLFYFADHYFLPICACPLVDCHLTIDGPDGAGLAPKLLSVTWSVAYDDAGHGVPETVYDGSGYTANDLFGTDNGAAKILTWDGVDGNGVSVVGGSHWTSGCLPGPGNDIVCTFVSYPVGSVRLDVWCNHDGQFMEAIYQRWSAGGCSGGLCTTRSTLGGGSGFDSGLCSPVDITLTSLLGSGPNGETFTLTCHIVEA